MDDRTKQEPLTGSRPDTRNPLSQPDPNYEDVGILKYLPGIARWEDITVAQWLSASAQEGRLLQKEDPSSDMDSYWRHLELMGNLFHTSDRVAVLKLDHAIRGKVAAGTAYFGDLELYNLDTSPRQSSSTNLLMDSSLEKVSGVQQVDDAHTPSVSEVGDKLCTSSTATRRTAQESREPCSQTVKVFDSMCGRASMESNLNNYNERSYSAAADKRQFFNSSRLSNASELGDNSAGVCSGNVCPGNVSSNQYSEIHDGEVDAGPKKLHQQPSNDPEMDHSHTRSKSKVEELCTVARPTGAVWKQDNCIRTEVEDDTGNFEDEKLYPLNPSPIQPPGDRGMQDAHTLPKSAVIESCKPCSSTTAALDSIESSVQLSNQLDVKSTI